MSDRTGGSTRATSASPRTTSSSAAAKPACSPSSAATARSSGGSVPTSAHPRSSARFARSSASTTRTSSRKACRGRAICWCSTTAASSGYGFANPIAPEGRGAFARATSRVLEINPVTLELVWSYTNPRFFSTNISGAQRLPNGNTLITAGAGGRMFEVTREGTIVWEYMYPLFSGAQCVERRVPRLPPAVRLDSAAHGPEGAARHAARARRVQGAVDAA